MAFNVTGLVAYSKEVGFELMKSAIYKGQTAKHIRIVSGVGTSFKIPQITNTITLQADGCSLSSSGTTTFAQVTCTPCSPAYVNDLCVKDLQDYYTAEYLPASQMNGEDMGSFEQVILDDTAGRLAKKIDEILWSGDTTLSCTGFFGRIDTTYSGSVESVTYAAATGGTTTSNIIGLTDAMITAYTFDAVEETSSLWMSPSNYRKLLIAYRNANFYFDPNLDNREGFLIPGSLGVYARPTVGIGTDKRLVLTWDKNLIMGTRSEEDLSKLEVKYDDFNQVIRIYGAWAQDSQFAYPAQVYSWVIA